MVRPDSDYCLLAEGYYAGFEDNGDSHPEIIAPKMMDYLKSSGCPDKILLEIIQEYFGEDSPYQLEMWYEQSQCGTLLGNKIFFDKDEFDLLF